MPSGSARHRPDRAPAPGLGAVRDQSPSSPSIAVRTDRHQDQHKDVRLEGTRLSGRSAHIPIRGRRIGPLAATILKKLMTGRCGAPSTFARPPYPRDTWSDADLLAGLRDDHTAFAELVAR